MHNRAVNRNETAKENQGYATTQEPQITPTPPACVSTHTENPHSRPTTTQDKESHSEGLCSTYGWRSQDGRSPR
ncbi:Hypothetical predicted protein [Pelobates cultripes]|uniref:Uncharacterized protein n=1 Tax=Pelobates cultripes TaxID=61616 RepID=A0AAD1VZU1_PELCU|nr:Hypothetical predicted protein [Pelobates cultripes]